jgi:signal transduction histidine kinase
MRMGTVRTMTRWMTERIRFPTGLHLDDHIRAEMARRINRFRTVMSGLAVVAGITVAVLGFRRAWVVIAVAVVVLAHSVATRRRPRVATGIALDVILGFLTLELAGAPIAAMSIGYLTYGVITILLCKPVARVVLAGLSSIMFIGAAVLDLSDPEARAVWGQIVGWIAAVILVGLLLATVSLAIDLLQRHVEDVDHANRQLQTLADSKDALISTVSHEIRTPLAAVLGFSNVLEDSCEHFNPADAKEMAHLVAAESQAIALLVDDLVVAARADLGSLAVALQPVQLHAEIRAFLAEDARDGPPVDVTGQDVEVRVDPPRFRQVLRHLLGNAVVHGGSRVWIETDSGPGVGFVRICDNGDGIPAELRGDIFAPYVRGSDRVTQPESFGLGLTIARRLADAMGGSLTYRRTPEASVFELVLRSPKSSRAAMPQTEHPVTDTGAAPNEPRQRSMRHRPDRERQPTVDKRG